ncbi:glycoside hydrolase family 78 protein [Paenibacillus sp. sptzw28]|nr:glycoside hydrolase family 78 protein [Paenibacillus sp. sptzw28]
MSGESKEAAQEITDWQASWIWGAGEESPRNEWRCFRKVFSLPAKMSERAAVKITGDSRYVLYVNGHHVGRGPVRSWPFELAYDEYEIGHLLRRGAENVIAVLVMHFGVSTFQYLRGRGGLIAQIESGDSREPLLATDETWKTMIHAGHDTYSSRMSCQLPFTEITDSRAWNESWHLLEYDESGWESAVVIGPAGMEPWVRLVEKTIPHLTEEPVYPVRVESLHSVKPVPWAAVIDLRNLFAPESADHANNVQFSGLVATVIRVAKATKFIIGNVDSGRIMSLYGVNGVWHGIEAFTGKSPERFLEVNLRQGDNLIMLDVNGQSHGHGFHIGFDCEEPFEVLAPPLPGKPSSQAVVTSGNNETPVPLTSPNKVSPHFIAIGPFDTVEVIDHRDTRPLLRDHPDFERAKRSSAAGELAELADWIKPVPAQMVNLSDVFTACVWKKSRRAQPVPHTLQNAVIAGANAAFLPMVPDMDTELVIDFGRELSGYIAFDIDASAGTVVDLYGFEFMHDGWIQHTYTLDNTLRYICREGRQTYTSNVRRGLRFLMVTVRGSTAPVKLYEVKMLQSNYPVADVGRFHCSDPLLNDIWQISRNTTILCMEDTFVDCPAFEQAFWVGDARNEALINYYLFGASDIVERCLRLVPGSSFQTPLYADQVPSGWNSVIPNWTFFWVTACLEYHRFSGDRAFAEDMWPHVRFTLDHFLQRLDDKGLLRMKGWNFLDWAAFEQPMDGVVTPQNMFLVKGLRDAARLAEAAGEREAAQRYLESARQLRAAIDEQLWDDNRQAYLDCIHADGSPSVTISMQTQVVAFLCGIAEGERARVLEQYIAVPPASFVQIGTPFMSFFYHEALAELNRIELLLEDIRTQYGVMVEYEASSCWEKYPSSGARSNPKLLTRSHCHAWSAGPAYFLSAYVLGVRGVTPGWSKVVVAPQPAGLAWAKGAVPLPDGGRIDVSWRVNESGRRLTVRITAPHDLEIETLTPEGYEMKVERIDIG